MFEPTNDIERLLIEAARVPGSRAAFTTAMLKAELTACIDAAGAIRTVPLPDGSLAAAVFTSPNRALPVFGADALLQQRTGRDLLNGLRSNQAMLNPGADYRVHWSAADIVQMLDGMTTQTIDKPTPILLAHPAKRPEALIAALGRELSSLASVKGAWLLLAQRSGEPAQNWMLGVDHTGDWNEVRAAVGRAVKTVDLEGRMLDAMKIDASSLSDTLRTGIPLLAPRRRGFFNFFR